MGEAKRRGSLEDRKANAIARRQAEEARRAEQRARRAAELRAQASERQKLLSPQERKEAVLTVGGGHEANMLLAAMIGLGIGPAVCPSERVLLLDDLLDSSAASNARQEGK